MARRSPTLYAAPSRRQPSEASPRRVSPDTRRSGDALEGEGLANRLESARPASPLVEQLKPGGRMVIPVGPVTRIQKLLPVFKKENGDTVKIPKMPVRFVPLTGEKRNDRQA